MLVAVNLPPLPPKQGGGLGNRLQLFECIHENWPYLSQKFLLSFPDLLSATGKCQAITILENEILASSIFHYLFLLLEQKNYIITLPELSMSVRPCFLYEISYRNEDERRFSFLVSCCCFCRIFYILFECNRFYLQP